MLGSLKLRALGPQLASAGVADCAVPGSPLDTEERGDQRQDEAAAEGYGGQRRLSGEGDRTRLLEDRALHLYP